MYFPELFKETMADVAGDGTLAKCGIYMNLHFSLCNTQAVVYVNTFERIEGKKASAQNIITTLYIINTTHSKEEK
jgi:hypothetical protein